LLDVLRVIVEGRRKKRWGSSKQENRPISRRPYFFFAFLAFLAAFFAFFAIVPPEGGCAHAVVANRVP
jgi:hypothetical protein